MKEITVIELGKMVITERKELSTDFWGWWRKVILLLKHISVFSERKKKV
ncbi:hypothetical protein STRPO_0185 [Streptococcus porcinus str. Jelinkova 176]|uniref:Uncharacterized protein n=1 Tax=Streptococcus porcinus str. Jelinkova 176 TaxID=873448 RepID=A0ABN0CU00_STRPO|nr:hypothetical protein STRPO_0185 [Streptococcus porcinus str. Jelinkova 176]